MIKLFKTTISLLVLLACIQCAAWSQVCSFTVTGQLTDYQTGQYIPNHSVTIYGNSGSTTNVTTNPNGVYSYTIQEHCDSSLSLVLVPQGCSGIYPQIYTTTVEANQTINLPMTTCNPLDNMCTASFSYSSPINPATVNFSLTANSQGSVAEITSVLWNFGDGLIEYTNSPSHTYTASGTYTVLLYVYFENGCIATYSHDVTVTLPTSCPYTVQGQILDGQNNNQPIANHTVNIQTPSGTVSVLTNANGFYSYVYMDTCNAYIPFYISTQSSCDGNLSANIHVGSYQTGNKSFTFCNCNNYPTPPISVNMVNQAAYFFIPPVSGIMITLDYGDGTTGNTNFGSGYYDHHYTSPGVYTVCAMSSPLQCVLDTCFTVMALQDIDSSCTVQLEVSTVGNTAIFSYTGNDAFLSQPTSIMYYYGDGQAGTTAYHTYATAGTYYAYIVAQFATGCQAVSGENITVSTISDTCSYTINGQITNAQNGNQPVTGQALVFTSIYGIDTVYTNPNGYYTYTVTGTCDSAVTFNLVAQGFCGESIDQYVSVAPNQTQTQPFSFCHCGTGTASYQINGQYLTLSTNLGGPNIPMHITYGDGHSSNNALSYQTYHYTSAGTYTVCITTPQSCILDTCFTVVATQDIDSSCTAQINVGVSGNNINFSSVGTDNFGAQPTSVIWNMGNGYSTNNYPNGGSYTYLQNGFYDICATLTFPSGCVVSACEYNVAIGSPMVNYCGVVYYSSNFLDTSQNEIYPLNCSTFYLVKLDGSSAVIIDSAIVDNGNTFCFNQPVGQYTLLVVACDSVANVYDILPTYYQSELFWQDANILANNVQNFMLLQNGQNLQGPAQIGGNIYWGDDKAPGDPVVNVNVFLFDGYGHVITVAKTNSEGYYHFTDLPYGTYQINPEMVGYKKHSQYVTVTAETPNIDANNFYLGLGGFSVASIEEAYAEVIGLYPNPSTDIATLTLVSKQFGKGHIRMMDMTGKTVQQSNCNIIQGEQNILMDVQALPSGIYILTLVLNEQQMHIKLIKK